MISTRQNHFRYFCHIVGSLIFFQNHRSRFNDIFLGDHITAKLIETFWQELLDRDDPRLRNHPMRKVPNWKRLFIPLSIHGDGVPVLQVGKADTKSLDVLSMMSLFSKVTSSIKAKLLLTLGFGDILTDESEHEA